jgi:hypothetical protein
MLRNTLALLAAVLVCQMLSSRAHADASLYAGREGTGGSYVSTPEGASVKLNGELVGRTPLDLSNLGPWIYRVQILFDGGGSVESLVKVEAGRVVDVDSPLPMRRQVSVFREGTHLMFGGGLLGGTGLRKGVYGLDIHAGVNLGLSAAFDFRALGHFSLGVEDQEHAWIATAASAAFRYHFTSVYAMELGVRLGLMSDNWQDFRILPTVGAQLSPAAVRFGADRNYELTLSLMVQAAVGAEIRGGAGGISGLVGLAFARVLP